MKEDYSSIDMSEIVPDSNKKKKGRTIYDIVADLKKERDSPPVQQAEKKEATTSDFSRKICCFESKEGKL